MQLQFFYTNILRLLDEKGMSKHDLAKKSGVSISFLSDLTNGKGNPSLKVMIAIANALETSVTFLLENNDLDNKTLDDLYGETAKPDNELPDGFVRVHSLVLPKYKAYVAKEWEKKFAKKYEKK